MTEEISWLRFPIYGYRKIVVPVYESHGIVMVDLIMNVNILHPFPSGISGECSDLSYKYST